MKSTYILICLQSFTIDMSVHIAKLTFHWLLHWLYDDIIFRLGFCFSLVWICRAQLQHLVAEKTSNMTWWRDYSLIFLFHVSIFFFTSGGLTSSFTFCSYYLKLFWRSFIRWNGYINYLLWRIIFSWTKTHLMHVLPFSQCLRI